MKIHIFLTSTFILSLCNVAFAKNTAVAFHELIDNGDSYNRIAGIEKEGERQILWSKIWEKKGEPAWGILPSTDSEGKSFFALTRVNDFTFYILQTKDISHDLIEYQIDNSIDLREHLQWFGSIKLEAPDKIIFNYEIFEGIKNPEVDSYIPMILYFREGKFYDEKGDEIDSYDPSGIQQIREAARMGKVTGNLTSINLSEGIPQKSMLIYAKDRKPPEEKTVVANDTADAKESEKLPEDIPDETPQNDTAQPSPESLPSLEITPPSTSVSFWYYIAIALGSVICLSGGIYWKTKKRHRRRKG